MIKVKNFKKLKGNSKKYEITFEKNGKTYTRKFGAAGMSDYTIHKDKERRERYISRHKKDLRTNDPMKAGYLSMYILWNKPTLKASLADYKRRLNIYNKTGKFPKDISGSKKLSFGTVKDMKNYSDIERFFRDKTGIDISVEEFEPELNRNLRNYSASKISAAQRGKTARRNLPTKENLKDILLKLNIREHGKAAAYEQMRGERGTPWEVLDPGNRETANWLSIASNTLTEEDFANDKLWYNTLEHILSEFIDMDPANEKYYPKVERNLTVSKNNVEVLMRKIGYQLDFDEDEWYTGAHEWLTEEWETDNAFGKKYKVPDNVVNKKLYESIKSKIKRDVKGRRWGAYDSGRLVREYKAAGGKYKGTKGKTNLSRWYKEKWVDACAWPKRKPCGRKTKEKIAYCRPSKRIDSKTPKLVQQLTKAQIKSRCAKKKKSPMKRVTKFGATREIVDKMRQQMYNQIMTSSDVSSGIENTISKRCKRGFQDSFCQSIFTDLLLSIYYTIVKNSVSTDNRKQNISEMKKFTPNNFNPTLLKINKSHFSKIDKMLYLLQDHSYGTFKNARVASLLYEYIHRK